MARNRTLHEPPEWSEAAETRAWINEIYHWYDEVRRDRAGSDIIQAIEEKIRTESNANVRALLNFILAQEHKAQSGRAVEEEGASEDSNGNLHQWYYQLRRTKNDNDLIAAINDRIQGEANPHTVDELNCILASEHRLQGNYSAAEAIYLGQFEKDQDDPNPLMSLAQQKLYDEDRPDLAMPIIDRAVEMTYRSGDLRRLALGIKARIASQIEAYQVVEGILRQLIDLRIERGQYDIGIERDFLDRLPAGSISAEVARQYHQFCEARAKTQTRSRRSPSLEAKQNEHGQSTTIGPYQYIDGLILSSAGVQWQKVAMIIAKVMSACKRNDIDINEYDIAARIHAMVDEGKLDAQGNLLFWRRSEVKLPNRELLSALTCEK